MRSKRHVIQWIGAVVLASAAGVWAWQSGYYRKVLAWGDDKQAGGGAMRFFQVRRGTLPIGLTEGGSLRAVKNYTIDSKLRGNSKISWLIAEGAKVKAGDKLVEFETKPTLDQINVRESDLEQAKRQLVVAEENLRIEVSNGKSLVAASHTKLDDMKEALKRFTQLDAPKRFKDMEDRALAARKAYDDASKALSDTQKTLDEGMLQDEAQRTTMEKQVQSSRDSLRNAQKTLSSIAVEQKLYRGYDYPRDLDARKQAVTNAELDLAKTEVAAKSQILQKEAELGRVRDQIQRITKDLADLKGEIDKGVLKAPVDGMVLYGESGGGGGGMVFYGGRGGQAETKVGAEFYPGQTIMTIPDLSAFEIDISIGEEYRGKLRKGCRSIVTVEAVPGLIIEGTLKTISDLAQPRSYYDPASPKAFHGVIGLSNSDPRMVSGMSARVQIIAETVENALMVPVEAIFNEGGKPQCFLRTGSGYERRPVRVGPSNDDYVQILANLDEGESVCMFMPPELAATAQGEKLGPASAPASAPASGPASAPTSAPASQPASAPLWRATSMPTSAPSSGPAVMGNTHG